MYDYLIVGSGLFGSVFAYEANKAGKKCLVIDKRSHPGGNVRTENQDGINVHLYGPHIFHTSSERIWKYINQFCEFNNFVYSPIAAYKGDMYSLPFNMWTFNQLWGVITPAEARKKISEQTIKINDPKNLEEWAYSQVGKDVYEKLIKGYTIKQWQKDPKDLPSSIIKRLPFRFTYNNNYYNHKYSGIPIGGYSKIIDNLLKDIEVKLDCDFFQSKTHFEKISNKIVYTGKIDEFFDYKLGELEYRTLKFVHQRLEIPNFQGVAGINYTDESVPYTRIIEHKHFENVETNHTIITKEYPEAWSKKKTPYYPINDKKNNDRYKSYKDLLSYEKKYIFGGRLAEYKYYNMDQVIGSALSKAKKELKE
jgi:UDP-galactopyranose mutase